MPIIRSDFFRSPIDNFLARYLLARIRFSASYFFSTKNISPPLSRFNFIQAITPYTDAKNALCNASGAIERLVARFVI